MRWNPDEMEVTIKSLFREPCAVKAAYPVLTGGLGRRTVRQRALILPTGNLDDPTFETMVLKLRRTMEHAGRREISAQIQRLIAEQLYWVNVTTYPFHQV